MCLTGARIRSSPSCWVLVSLYSVKEYEAGGKIQPWERQKYVAKGILEIILFGAEKTHTELHDVRQCSDQSPNGQKANRTISREFIEKFWQITRLKIPYPEAFECIDRPDGVLIWRAGSEIHASIRWPAHQYQLLRWKKRRGYEEVPVYDKYEELWELFQLHEDPEQ